MDGDLGVALDAGDGIDDDALAHAITRSWPCPRTIGTLPARASCKHGEKIRSGGGRAPGQEGIHLDHVVQRQHPLEELRDDPASLGDCRD